MKPALFINCLISILLFFSCSEKRTDVEIVNKIPVIFPDYTGVTIPSTIAPLNFKLIDESEKLYLTIKGSKTGSIELYASDFFSIPEKKWKKMLIENIGGEIRLTVSAKLLGKWKQYDSFPIHISPDPIDFGLVYRLIAPGYEVYSKMGIYQRDISNFKQTAIFENTIVPESCVNCHAFNQTKPDKMSLHIRGSHGGTLIKNGDNMKMIDTNSDQTIGSCVYPYWHPSEKFIAYSVNKTRQVFHSSREKLIEVLDLESDIVVYDTETHELLSCELLSSSNLETFPVFSPDGKTLYFCSANEQNLPYDYMDVRYNLCSIAFNPENKTFGDKIDTLIHADIQGKSISFPKPSFDGKYIMYTLLDYGNFGIWHQEADLYLFDLENAKIIELPEVNSLHAESYHNWSSNSRWFVFESRRIDGLYTRLYIASIDENGKAGKPFLLPQKTPDHNSESFFSYNVPEFVNTPVKLNANKAEKIIKAQERQNVKYKN